MKHYFYCWCIIFIIKIIVTTVKGNDYWSDRQKLIETEQKQSIGGDLILTDKERTANKILMTYKIAEMDEGFLHPEKFLPALHFFKTQPLIAQSKVFNIIKKLPKGASLHSHDTALVSNDFLYNLTFSDNLYGCVSGNSRLNFHFFDASSTNHTTTTCKDWKLIKEMRSNNETFERYLKTQLTIIVDDPTTEYADLNDVWTKFIDTFITVGPLIGYKPIFETYFYEALKELYEDNVTYLEFRGVLPIVYDLDGNEYGPEAVTEMYVRTLDRFKKDYPKFHGARFIYAPSRKVDNKTATDYVKIALNLKKLFPDFIAGFDLVGQEDLGDPLMDFVTQLTELSQNGMKFFFHAGETNWNGASTDFNLIDAVLLNTSRIGHGYGLLKHPVVLNLVKERDIAIEISPISNQVLKLVDDVRNHPGAVLINGGYPVVICCDDPSFWGAVGLSYDWYQAFMGMASREADLRLLKQLAINSLIYSAMEEVEKQEALANWEKSWEEFLDEIIQDYQMENYYYHVERVK